MRGVRLFSIAFFSMLTFSLLIKLRSFFIWEVVLIFIKTSWQEHKEYLKIAVPFVLSTLASPLIGVVDTAIMGRLSLASYIGGVSVSVLIFNTLYWLLGFLRVTTSGFSAQSLGDTDPRSATLALMRPMLLAFIIATVIVVLQYPIKSIAFFVLNPTDNIREIAAQYYDIRIWSTPFTLFNYVITGWLLGMGKVKFSLLLQVFMNIVNIAFSYSLVMHFDMKADGVAWAALIAESSTTFLSFVVMAKISLLSWSGITFKELYAFSGLMDMMRMNRDLFVRTLCLLTTYNAFGYFGLRYGETILAANAVLMQVHFIMAHILGGIGNTNTVFVGKAFGKKDAALYFKTMKISTIWGALTAIIMAVTIVVFDKPIISFFTNIQEVIDTAREYYFWLAFFPLVTFWGLLLYGSFVGATNGVPIRNSLIMSLILFFASLYLTEGNWQNHGLWFAFVMFSFGRTIFLWPYLPKQNKLFAGFKNT